MEISILRAMEQYRIVSGGIMSKGSTRKHRGKFIMKQRPNDIKTILNEILHPYKYHFLSGTMDEVLPENYPHRWTDWRSGMTNIFHTMSMTIMLSTQQDIYDMEIVGTEIN